MADEITPEQANAATYVADVAPAQITKVKHKKCSTVTDLGAAMAKSHRANPGLFMNFACGKCGGVHPVAEFAWEGGEEFAKGPDEKPKL